ncbi:haloacid dehalogenase-like hydrolase [Rahnella sp. SAP-1]|jgi:hypothetical protein|uniref:Haloacid dehalogenase-like hydrolase n=1 Tax=Rouxiella aceris TaxID=2703884 RepID=A0A848MCY9_9GAMM|nr:haloacid dehalogenase-like hydrolase [Rouxiella aceris]NMP26128.1 haloacid dehalogenase-like hydrolase [Rouxiella aceris]
MHKRYLDCCASELAYIDRQGLLESLRASEGRILISETIGAVQPMLMGITNAELAASQGADLLLLNLFDVDKPQIQGLPLGIAPEHCLRELQRLTGRVIGVNLEAVDPDFKDTHGEFWAATKGRLATAENARKLVELGAKFVVLTGNPGNGISNETIGHCLQEIRQAAGDSLVIVAGKMHAAGILARGGEKIITCEDVSTFVAKGADIVLLPAPGTVPGISQQYIEQLVTHAHQLGAMTLTAIGTSQEGASVETIRQIALMCKMTGTDLHHIGDTGYTGMALPENIMAYSVAIRGIRHTYSRMARSINR